MGDPLLSSCLVECGFDARRLLPVQLLATNGRSLPATTLRVQMLENDEAYNHRGCEELWA